MRTVILESITEMAPEQWNAIVGHNRLICRWEFLRAVESSRINDCRYFYPVVYDGDTMVAHTCVYFITTELDVFAQGLLKQGSALVRRVWSDFLMLKSAECGTPIALGNTLSFRPETDTARALSALVEATESVARRLGVRVVLFRDFLNDETERFDRLTKAGYVRIRNLPTVRLAIRWRAMEDYIGAMRSEYRHKVKDRMARFKRVGGTLTLSSSFSSQAEELAGLWRNTYDRAREYRRERLDAAFFRNFEACLGARSAVLTARIQDKTVGFSLLLRNDDSLEWMFCGLDYTCNDTACVYFNMMYRVIDVAIVERRKDVDMGITTLGPKMEAGGVVTPLNMYMRHLTPGLGRIVPRLFDMMAPPVTEVARNVFRS